MKSIGKYIIAALLIFHCYSCEKNVDIKIRDEDKVSKLVVGCYISPQDTIISVDVSRSVPLYATTTPGGLIVNTATVTISDGAVTKQLVYNATTGKYTISASVFPIIAGKTYKLEVSADNYKAVSAITDVPLLKNISLQLDSEAAINPDNDVHGHEVAIKAKWQDKAGEVNYYRVMYVLGRFNASKNDTSYIQLNSYNIINDNNKDGGILEMTQNLPLKRKGQPSSSPYGYDNCYVYLLNTSKVYYDYYLSLQNYTSDDPFSEATPIYSNIENGLGIFAGYNGYKMLFK